VGAPAGFHSGMPFRVEWSSAAENCGFIRVILADSNSDRERPSRESGGAEGSPMRVKGRCMRRPDPPGWLASRVGAERDASGLRMGFGRSRSAARPPRVRAAVRLTDQSPDVAVGLGAQGPRIEAHPVELGDMADQPGIEPTRVRIRDRAGARSHDDPARRSDCRSARADPLVAAPFASREGAQSRRRLNTKS
jgi:hypothetical protein